MDDPRRERRQHGAAEELTCIGPAGFIAAAADAAPPSSRQTIAERTEAGEAAKINQADVEQQHDGTGGEFMTARDHRRKQKLDEQEERQQDRHDDQEANEHLFPGAAPFEPVTH